MGISAGGWVVAGGVSWNAHFPLYYATGGPTQNSASVQISVSEKAKNAWKM
eukprot:COSAG05_NODE_13908_length_414_cov_1.304762_1_plen_50_part_10